jgi:signal recognition particle GTPase
VSLRVIPLHISYSVLGISLRRRITEVSNLNLSHVRQMMKNLDQMQKMWSAIIVTRKGTTKDFVGCRNKIWMVKRIIMVP